MHNQLPPRLQGFSRKPQEAIMYKRIALFISLFILMMLILAACGGDATPAFQAYSTKDNVDIRSTYKDGAVTFNIYAQDGIGGATVELIKGEMPDVLQVRLFVKGLENLELAYDDVAIIASVPTSGGAPVEKIKQGGQETAIDVSSPYWLDIQPLPAKAGGVFVGEPALPPSFLITMPEDFHQSKATKFELKWVDFHR